MKQLLIITLSLCIVFTCICTQKVEATEDSHEEKNAEIVKEESKVIVGSEDLLDLDLTASVIDKLHAKYYKKTSSEDFLDNYNGQLSTTVKDKLPTYQVSTINKEVGKTEITINLREEVMEEIDEKYRESRSSYTMSANGPWSIPDNSYRSVYFNNNSFAPSGSAVTNVEYRLKIDDTGDPNSFYCGDYEIYLSSSSTAGVQEDINVYNNLGGRTDDGYDDDADDDSDIYIDYRSTSYFNGESANQYWGVKIKDTQTQDTGELEYLTLVIHWEDNQEPNLTRAAGYSSLTVNGTQVDLSIRVINDGTGSAGSSHVAYYLSSDTNIDPSNDYEIGTDYVTSLSAGDYSNESISVDVNNGTIPPGTYYVGYFIDYQGEVTESNENDNKWYFSSPQVTIPQQMSNLTRAAGYSSLAVNGTQVDLSIRVINDGSGSAGSSHVAYYLSSDTNIDPSSDYEIGTDGVSSLSPGDYSNESISVDVNNGTIPPGTYYVGYFIDYQDEVTESNENDNKWYFSSPQVTIPQQMPNLTRAAGYSSLTVNGTQVDLSIRVINDGSGSAGSSHVAYYLSSDTNIDPSSDYEIGTDGVSSLSPGDYSNESISVDVNNGTIPPGTYYVGYFIDYQDEVTESNENDNKWYFSSPQVTIPQEEPDIAVSPTSYNYGTIQVGNHSDKTFTISNTGNATLNVTNQQIVGQNPDQFSIINGGGSFNLSPGTTHQTIVRFQPNSDDSFNATFRISSNDSDENPFDVPLSGIGNETQNPDIDVFPTALTINEPVSRQQTSSNHSKESEKNFSPIPKINNKYLKRTFIDKNGSEIDEIIVPGKPPENYRAPIAVPSRNSVILPDVPAYDWSFGCSATAAAMIAGHYDNTDYTNMYTGTTNGGVMPMNNSVWGSIVINGETRKQCPLSATRNGLDGKTTRGHVDDYWVSYGSTDPDPYITNGWTEHTSEDCTGDFMKTSQSVHNITDGATRFYFGSNGSPCIDGNGHNDDGCHGLRLFYESRGYDVIENYSQYIFGYNGNTLGFTFEQFKQEIDAGRPVIIQVEGHSMVGYGYDDTGNTVYIHDTWDYNDHSMTWGGSYSGMQHYGVTVVHLSEPNTEDNTFTIQNTGNGTLTINSITDNQNWLSTSGFPSTPFNIQPNESQTITVSVNWSLLGDNPETGTITINSNDPDENSVDVTVTAVPASNPNPVYLTMDDVEGGPGYSDIPLVLSLDNLTDNDTPVASLQLSVQYDATIGIHANGNYNLTARTQGFTASVSVTENGANSEALILLYSMSGATISPGTGAIIEILFNVDSDAIENDTSPLSFSECFISDSSANPITSNCTDTAIFTIAEPCELGDINCDGTINIFDLQLLINVVTGSQTDPVIVERSDLNGDGMVNIFDLQLLINIITGNSSIISINSNSKSLPATRQINNLILPEIQLQQNGTGTFGVNLINEDAVASGQIRFNYDSTIGFSITGVNTTSRTSDFTTVLQENSDDPTNVEILVLFYSFGSTIDIGSGDILAFDYVTTSNGSGSTPLTFTETLLSDLNGNSLQVDSQNGNAAFYVDTHFEFTPNTGSNYSIFVYSALLDEISLQNGDEIGVFTPNDLCAGAVIWNSANEYQQLIAWGDDPQTNEIDGFSEGETLHYRFWDASEELEINSVTPTYQIGNGTWGDGALAEVNLNGFSFITQQISLNNGWNLISTHVDPAEPDMEMIWEEIESLIMVKACNGDTYSPEYGNFIGDWQALESYNVYLTADDVLEIVGGLVTPDAPIPLSLGWNGVSYLPQQAIDAEIALASIQGHMVICKAGNGNTYSQYGNFIGDMIPGQGYLIYTNSDCNLIYDYDNSRSLTQNKLSVTSRDGEHFIFTNNTGSSYPVFVNSVMIDGINIEDGDEVGIFTPEGLCAGCVVWNDSLEYNQLIAWGDNDQTEEIDGFIDSELMYYRLWDASENIETLIAENEVNYVVGTGNWGDGVFSEVTLQPITKFNENTTISIPDNFSLSTNYPNPFNPTTTITYSLPTAEKVTLEIYDLSGKLVKTLVNEKKQAGYHSIEWNGTDETGKQVSSGVYFYKITAGKEYNEVKQMLLLK